MNFYERAAKALNAANDCEAGRDSIASIESAMQDARDDAFEEAAKIMEKLAESYEASAEAVDSTGLVGEARSRNEAAHSRWVSRAAVARDAADTLRKRKGSVSR